MRFPLYPLVNALIHRPKGKTGWRRFVGMALALMVAWWLSQEPINASISAPCQVKYVIDGDTAEFHCAGWQRSQRVRLVGFNAPDKCQPKFQEATQWLKHALSQGTISLQIKGNDQYNRTLAKVLVDNQPIHPPPSLTAPRKQC